MLWLIKWLISIQVSFLACPCCSGTFFIIRRYGLVLFIVYYLFAPWGLSVKYFLGSTWGFLDMETDVFQSTFTSGHCKVACCLCVQALSFPSIYCQETFPAGQIIRLFMVLSVRITHSLCYSISSPLLYCIEFQLFILVSGLDWWLSTYFLCTCVCFWCSFFCFLFPWCHNPCQSSFLSILPLPPPPSSPSHASFFRECPSGMDEESCSSVGSFASSRGFFWPYFALVASQWVPVS